MLFVIVTRDDLREEFNMADEAFALSPISARATLPSEEDYAAISEAFMETSRGRWFLTEYAKRNRNADTRMVLDAVTRIEQNLAAQKEERLQREENLRREEAIAAQEQAVAATARAATASAEAAAASAEAATATAAATAAAAAAAAAENSLNEALGAIRAAVEAAQESAVEAIDSLALEQRLAPVRKGARVLREIAWRLREIGNDGRICDLIDSQVAVIEKGAQQISSEDAKIALRAAFAALEGRLATFSDEERAPAPAAETWTPATRSLEIKVAEIKTTAPASRLAPPPAFVDTIEKAPAQQRSEASPASLAAPAEAALAEVKAVLVEAAEAPAGAEAAGEVVDAQEAEAQDEALLDAIAMEMGAPDPISDEEIAAAAAEEARAHQSTPVEPEIVKPGIVEPEVIKPAVVAAAPEPVVTRPVEPPVQQVVQLPPQPVAQVEPAPVSAPAPTSAPPPAMEMSLGSTIIASGMLRKPATAANDPLAPIRRMSQAEKIAFFS